MFTCLLAKMIVVHITDWERSLILGTDSWLDNIIIFFQGLLVLSARRRLKVQIEEERLVALFDFIRRRMSWLNRLSSARKAGFPANRQVD